MVCLLQALDKGLPTDALVLGILAGVNQDDQEVAQFRFETGVLDQQRQLA